jgi:hypothetical protein
MNVDAKIVLRMRDVGCALDAASDYDVRLNRIGLQKFIYLSDSLSRLFEILAIRKGYETYKHGPYDKSIQNAVDCLCFRRLATVTRSAISTAGLASYEYELSAAGKLWVKNLVKLDNMHQRWELFKKLAAQVNDNHRWYDLRELVYAEPTFVNTKAKGWGQPLDVAEGSGTTSITLLNAMRVTLKAGFQSVEPTVDLLLDLYFQYLQMYADSQQRLR